MVYWINSLFQTEHLFTFYRPPLTVISFTCLPVSENMTACAPISQPMDSSVQSPKCELKVPVSVISQGASVSHLPGDLIMTPSMCSSRSATWPCDPEVVAQVHSVVGFGQSLFWHMAISLMRWNKQQFTNVTISTESSVTEVQQHSAAS